MGESNMVEFKIKGKQMLMKKPSKHGTGAVIYVPKDWIGKPVAVILEGE